MLQPPTTNARAIVDALLEDDDLKDDALRLAADYQWRDLDFEFAFAIGTGSEDMLQANADEAKITLNRSTAVQLTKDALRVEQNVMAALKAAGIRVEDHGHDGTGDLVGSAFIQGKKPPGWHAVAWSVSRDEPLMTGSGTIWKVPGLQERIWKGVSTLGQRLLDVSISFYQTKGISDFVDEFPDSDT